MAEKNDFILFDQDAYQAHYVPTWGVDDPYRWMLSVSPHGEVRLKDPGIELDYVEDLSLIYDIIKKHNISSDYETRNVIKIYYNAAT